MSCDTRWYSSKRHMELAVKMKPSGAGSSDERMNYLRLLLALPLLNMACFAQPLVLHVATNGNDAWSGTRAAPNARKTDGPLASLDAAVTLARARRAATDGV